MHQDNRTGTTADVIEELRRCGTCALANAIEHLHVRLHNEGYTSPGLHPLTVPWACVVGYAVTSRVKTTDPPVMGEAYCDRSDWWSRMNGFPAPRIAVIEDADPTLAADAVIGEVHSAILHALGCEAVITNGAVRDIPALAARQFPVFGARVALSHGYSHMIEFGAPVEIFGLRIAPGALLVADCHGALAVPSGIAAELPRIVAEMASGEARIIDFCSSQEFSIDGLRRLVKEGPYKCV